MVIRRRPKIDLYAELEQPYKELAKHLDKALEALNEISAIVSDDFPRLPKAINETVLNDLIGTCEECSEYVWDPDGSYSLSEAFEELVEFCKSCDVSDICSDLALLEELSENETDEGSAAEDVDMSIKTAATSISQLFDFITNLSSYN